MIALAFYARHHQEMNALLEDGRDIKIIFPPTMPDKERSDIQKIAEMVGGLAKKECTELLLGCRDDLVRHIQASKLPCNIELICNRSRWDHTHLHLLDTQNENKGRSMLGMTVESHESRLVIVCWVWTRGGRAVADALVEIIGSPPATSGRDWHPDWKDGGTIVLGHHPILPDEAHEVDSQKLCAAVTSTFRVLDKEKIRKIIELSKS